MKITPEIRRLIELEIGRAFARSLGVRIYDCENDTQREGFLAQESETAEAWRKYAAQFEPETA